MASPRPNFFPRGLLNRALLWFFGGRQNRWLGAHNGSILPAGLDGGGRLPAKKLMNIMV